MAEKPKVLLVHHNSETLIMLELALERLGMSVSHASSRAQAKRMLGGSNPVPLVFTDTQMPDSTWADVIALAGKTTKPVNVIVVARVVDTRFYVEVIESGAFDFIAPPFHITDLEYVVRTAMDNAVGRRAALTAAEQRAPEAALLSEMSKAGARAIPS